MKQNLFTFEGLTDDSSHTAEEELIKIHCDIHRIELKQKILQQLVGLEECWSCEHPHKLLFFFGKTTYFIFFCMLMRAVRKL